MLYTCKSTILQLNKKEWRKKMHRHPLQGYQNLGSSASEQLWTSTLVLALHEDLFPSLF